ncbi:MAG: class I SAM-dependent methyltransferase [Mariprofundus sp.]|nr:class I SAM-dependent methyltransferase [Mariprofundus sp.]
MGWFDDSAGEHIDCPFYIAISGPDVLASILKHPNAETLLRLYSLGHIDLKSGDIISFMHVVRQKGKNRQKIGQMNKSILLRDRGILLNHGIARRAKASNKAWRRIRPEQKLLKKYIFPGSGLDSIGHTVDLLQVAGFEIHDIEGWREHYAKTCKLWHDALVSNRDQAIEHVGPEKYRLWLLYLAGVAIAFAQGSTHVYQVVASKHAARGFFELPLTRKDLYS